MKGDLHNSFEDQVRRKLENFEEYPPHNVLERIKATANAGAAATTVSRKSKGLWYGLVTFAALLTASTIYFFPAPEEEMVVSTEQASLLIAETTTVDIIPAKESKAAAVKSDVVVKQTRKATNPEIQKKAAPKLSPEAGGDIEVCGLSAKLNGTLSVQGSVGRWKSESKSVSFISNTSDDPETDPEATIKVSDYGVYVVKWTESVNRAIAFDEMTIHFKPVPEVSLGEDQAVCGIECELNSGGSNGFWKGSKGIEVSNPNESVTKIKSVESGQYKLVWIENNDMCSSSDTILLTFVDQPIAEIKMESVGACYSSPVRLSCLYHDDYSYKWNFDEGEVHNLGKENYLVTWAEGNNHKVKLSVINKSSCESFAELSIELPERIDADFDYKLTDTKLPAMVYFTNQSTAVSETVMVPEQVDYLWDFGDGTTSTDEHPDHFYSQSGIYAVTLIARDMNGCSDTVVGQPFEFKSETRVSGKQKYFTPNGDGMHDVFRLNFEELTNYHCVILAQNGNKIMEWRDPSEGWDGNLKNGSPADQGLYYYVVRGNNRKGEPVEIPGLVMLQRN